MYNNEPIFFHFFKLHTIIYRTCATSNTQKKCHTYQVINTWKETPGFEFILGSSPYFLGG